MSSGPTLTPLAEFGVRCDDAAWLNSLKAASIGSVVDGVRFPSPPDPKWQSNFVGMSGATALEDAFGFYQFVKAEYKGLSGSALGATTRVLDFGCGWGRYLLFFMKDVTASNLWGVDVDPDVIGFVRLVACRCNSLPCHHMGQRDLRQVHSISFTPTPYFHILPSPLTLRGCTSSGVSFVRAAFWS